jgi:protein TonB
MHVKIPLSVVLLGLLLVSAIPSYAQTDVRNARTNSVEAWKKKIVAQLASKRAFPVAATDQSGTAKVKFVIDRQGKLISRVLLESSGSELLDAAALTMIDQAEPFPEPPAKVTDDKLAFMVPVNFINGKQFWLEEQAKINAKVYGICRGC